MKKITKILSIMIVAACLFSGCGEETAESSSIISEVSVTVSENSQKEAHKVEKTSRAEKSHTESSKESSVQSSQQPSDESQEEISETSAEVHEDESSQAESSENSDESSEEVSEELSSEPERVIDESIVYEFDTKYFVKKLNEKMLKGFLEMYDAVQHFDTTARFTETMPSADLDVLMFLLNYDCPELIQLNGDYSPIYTDESEETVSGVYFVYNMNENDCKEHMDELHLFFENLKADIGDSDEPQKEKYVYDMIFSECVYDDENSYSGTVYGTLINHIGRCEGICKSFMWCMRELGVECMCVSGTPKWETDSVYSGHSWNIVKINDEYYQLDLTIDNIKERFSDDNHANYGFFNVNDEFSNMTHEMYPFYENIGVPSCDSEEWNYHKMNGLYVSADGDIEEQVKNILENNFSEGIINHISVKFENIAALNNAYAHIDDWIKEFFKEKGLSLCESHSESDKVCQTITVYAEGSEECSDE